MSAEKVDFTETYADSSRVLHSDDRIMGFFSKTSNDNKKKKKKDQESRKVENSRRDQGQDEWRLVTWRTLEIVCGERFRPTPDYSQ